jgi:CBS domain-containing protein
MMTARPVTIVQNGTLHQALEAMARIGCHHLPVLSSEGHIVGIITDSDCRRALKRPTTLPRPGSRNRLPISSVCAAS